MKYKISLGGRGSECFLFRLKEGQADELLESGVEKDEMSIDDISDYLEIESVFDCENTVLGAYYGEHYITIEDEEGNEIFNSDKSEENLFEENDWKDGGFEKEDYLVVEDYSKGEFFTFEVECDEFDVTKLKPIITEVAECRDLITGFYYEGEELEREFGDYWSKGFYYIVYKNEFY